MTTPEFDATNCDDCGADVYIDANGDLFEDSCHRRYRRGSTSTCVHLPTGKIRASMTTYEEALTEAVRLAESATELIRHHHTGERASAMAQASRTWAAIATLLARYGPLDRGDAEPATDADLSKACGCQGGTRWREHEQERGRGS